MPEIRCTYRYETLNGELGLISSALHDTKEKEEKLNCEANTNCVTSSVSVSRIIGAVEAPSGDVNCHVGSTPSQ